MIGLGHYLTVAAVLFTLGIFGIFLNRKNVIVILMSVELMLLAVNINFVAFSTFMGDLVGQVFALFVLTVAAGEAAIGLAIVVVYFRNRGSIAVEDINMMKADRMALRSLTPMLQTSDMERTVAWYQQTLDFRCVRRVGNDWCQLERDGVSLMFMQNAHVGAPHATATQYIHVDDVDAVWDSLKDRCRPSGGRRSCPTACVSSRSRIPTVTI